MASSGLRARDLRRVLDVVASCEGIDGPGERPQALLSGLLTAVGGAVSCDVLFWQAFERRPFREIDLVAMDGCDPRRAPLEGWVEHLDEHPVMSGRHGPVVAVSDVLGRREFERTWMYQNAFRPAGVRHEIGLELSHPADGMSVLVLSRWSGRDFDDDAHLSLALLRPHVDAALRRVTQPPPRLTLRQLDVLRLVRDGLTDAQVARRTGVTEATVGKHLERVFARTGARNRVQAVALCSGLLDNCDESAVVTRP